MIQDRFFSVFKLKLTNFHHNFSHLLLCIYIVHKKYLNLFLMKPNVISFCHQIDPGQPAHQCSLTRLYTVGWPTSSTHLDITKMKMDNHHQGITYIIIIFTNIIIIIIITIIIIIIIIILTIITTTIIIIIIIIILTIIITTTIIIIIIIITIIIIIIITVISIIIIIIILIIRSSSLSS